METIALTTKFLKDEVRAYSAWQTGFCREYVQNSFDARATEIHFQIETTPQGTGFECRDNGCGMDERVLREVYFRLGETTKAGGDSIGGFGRARILTTFSHLAYEMRTQEVRAHGSGTEFEIVRTPGDYFPGCRVRVTLDPELTTASALLSDLRSYLALCHLADCRVTINGERFTGWTYRNKRTGDLSFGKVYRNKSREGRGVLIRVNGVHMFTRYTPCRWQIVLELDPAQARSVLTSNRDGMTYKAGEELERFIGDIWINPLSATDDAVDRRREAYGDCVQRIRRRGAKAPEAESVPHAGAPIEGERPLYVGSASDLVSAFRPLGPDETPETEAAAPPPAKPAGPAFVVLSNTCNRHLRRAAKAFTPETLGAGPRLKLLLFWNALCTACVEELCEITGADGYAVQTGFAFYDDAGALHHRHADGPDGELHDLLFKPVDGQGRLAFKLSRPEDRARLLALAAHEVAHMRERCHDQLYASTLTELFARVVARFKELERAYREIASARTPGSETVPLDPERPLAEAA